MKNLIVAIIVLFSVHAFAEAENEVVTDADFQKVQKELVQKEKMLAAKTPNVLPSSSYVNNPSANVGKKFRMMFVGDDVVGFGCYAKPKPGCDFRYISMDDRGHGSRVGDGLYSFECSEKKVCKTIEATEGQDVSSTDVVIEFVNITQIVDKQGRKKSVPHFRVLSLE